MPKGKRVFNGYHKELRVRMTNEMYVDLKVIADREERSVAAMVRVMVALCVESMSKPQESNGE